MVVEKIGVVKLGNFEKESNLELINNLKFRTIILSKYTLFEKYLEDVVYDPDKVGFKLRDYEKIVSRKLRNAIFEVENRINKNVSKKGKFRKLNNNQFYRLILRKISSLWFDTKKNYLKTKEIDLILVFYQGNLKGLIDEIYFRFSGVSIQNHKQKVLDIKNNFISYKRLLAKLWGEQLIKIYEKMQDYKGTNDEEFEVLAKQLISCLENTKKWYLDRGDDLSYLRRCYNIFG